MDTSGDGPLVPSHWNDKDKSPLLEVTQGLQVKYLGLGESDKDAAAVRTNHPIPPSVGHFYFEITIKNKGRDGYIGIGLCAGSTSMNRLPGWEKHSYGYHGDDGNAFCFSGTGNKYGPTFSSDDVIGCCVNFLDHTCFYTKNGQKLEVAFRDLDRKEGVGKSPTKLYPCVGLRTPGEEIEANFGQTPFVFDIESEISELRQRAHRMVTSTVLDSKGWQQQHIHAWQAPAHELGRRLHEHLSSMVLVLSHLCHSVLHRPLPASNDVYPRDRRRLWRGHSLWLSCVQGQSA